MIPVFITLLAFVVTILVIRTIKIPPQKEPEKERHPLRPLSVHHTEEDLRFLESVFDRCLYIKGIHRMSRDEEWELLKKFNNEYMGLNSLTEYTKHTDKIEQEIAWAVNRAINHRFDYQYKYLDNW